MIKMTCFCNFCGGQVSSPYEVLMQAVDARGECRTYDDLCNPDLHLCRDCAEKILAEIDRLGKGELENADGAEIHPEKKKSGEPKKRRGRKPRAAEDAGGSELQVAGMRHTTPAEVMAKYEAMKDAGEL